MPFLIKAVPPEWTRVQIGLMFTFAVQTSERMRAQFALFSFKLQRVDLKVYLTTPGEVAMMFDLM